MKDISKTLEYRGVNYKIVFNLNVMQAIQEEYGSLEKWGELTGKEEGEPDAKAVIFGFWAMLNEGIDIENDEKPADEKIEPLTLKKVGRILSEVGMGTASEQMADVIIESTKSGDDSKNE